MERVLAGDNAAFATLYEKHHAEVRTVGRRILGDAALAEDVVQEVFETLPRSLRGFRNEAGLSAFVLGIAVRKAKGYIRSAIRRRRTIANFSTLQVGNAVDGQADADRGQLAQELIRALDQLPTAQRLAFVLCEIHEFQSAEAAIIMEVPSQTIRTRLHHAKIGLRKILGEGEI